MNLQHFKKRMGDKSLKNDTFRIRRGWTNASFFILPNVTSENLWVSAAEDLSLNSMFMARKKKKLHSEKQGQVLLLIQKDIAPCIPDTPSRYVSELGQLTLQSGSEVSEIIILAFR